MLKKVLIGTAIIVAVGFLAVQTVYAGPGRGPGPGQKGDSTVAVDGKGAGERQEVAVEGVEGENNGVSATHDSAQSGP